MAYLVAYEGFCAQTVDGCRCIGTGKCGLAGASSENERSWAGGKTG